jgi:hypothetical protein
MYFVIAFNNAKVVVVGEFNSPLSNYCNNLGSEGSGGSKVGAHKNLQVEDTIALVSFLTCYKSMAFKYLWKWSPIVDIILLGRSWMPQNVLSKKCPIVGNC